MFDWKLIIMFIVGCVGVVFGGFLGDIAREELLSGRKYFVGCKNILMVLLIVASIGFSMFITNYVLLGVLLAFGLLLLFVVWKFDYLNLELLLFVIISGVAYFGSEYTYFGEGSLLFQQSIASLLFVTGLCIGTLWIDKKLNIYNKLPIIKTISVYNGKSKT